MRSFILTLILFLFAGVFTTTRAQNIANITLLPATSGTLTVATDVYYQSGMYFDRDSVVITGDSIHLMKCYMANALTVVTQRSDTSHISIDTTKPSYHLTVSMFLVTDTDSCFSKPAADNADTAFATPGYLSVKDVAREKVVVYPNPSSGVVNISADCNACSSITVMNLAGQQVLKTVYSKTQTNHLDLTELPSGTYFLILKSSEGQIMNTAKLLKRE